MNLLRRSRTSISSAKIVYTSTPGVFATGRVAMVQGSVGVIDGRLLEQHDLVGRIRTRRAARRGIRFGERARVVTGRRPAAELGTSAWAWWRRGSGMLENIRGQHKVDAVVMVGEPGQVLMDHLAHERSTRMVGTEVLAAR